MHYRISITFAKQQSTKVPDFGIAENRKFNYQIRKTKICEFRGGKNGKYTNNRYVCNYYPNFIVLSFKVYKL